MKFFYICLLLFTSVQPRAYARVQLKIITIKRFKLYFFFKKRYKLYIFKLYIFLNYTFLKYVIISHYIYNLEFNLI